jgi:hypothetical protein
MIAHAGLLQSRRFTKTLSQNLSYEQTDLPLFVKSLCATKTIEFVVEA